MWRGTPGYLASRAADHSGPSVVRACIFPTRRGLLAMIMRTAVWLVLGVVGSCVAPSAWAENWPQWRGARLDGVSSATNLPAHWDRTTNVVWRVPLPGPAGATPVVWDDHIFVTSVDGEDLVLLCFDTEGKQRWRQVVSTGNRDVRGDEGNSASPSPATDGQHVWTFMGDGTLACYDFEGKEVWKFNMQNRYGRFQIQFGMTSTPVLDGDRLYFQLIHSGGAQVIALDKASGREAWRQPRPSDARAECEHSYASPILYRDGQREFLLTHGADYIVAHSLANGAELWRCGGLNPLGNYNPTLRFVASPVAVPGLIVVPSAKNGPVLGLRPTGRGNITVDRRHAATGQEYYQERTHADRHRASPVHADGKVFITARDGTITVVKAGRQFERLATNVMGESISSSPVIAGGTLYLRSFDALYAIRSR
jgi:outer membrane protein assembly factor BamB